jgi:hypothetical protein
MPVRARRPGLAEKRSPPSTDGERLPRRLTPAQIHAALRPLRARLVGCLKTHRITGTLRARVVVRGRDGRVTAVRVLGRPSGDAVSRCLLSRARAARFGRFASAQQISPVLLLKAP